MIMGLLTATCIFWPILALPAIICGIIALVKISGSKGLLKGTGLAVTGIAVPAIMVIMLPVLSMLLAILMPALSNVRHISQRVICGTNLHGLSTAMMVYANDNDDMLPTENWCDLLIEQADVAPKSFLCPDSEMIEGESSYAMNKNIAGMKLGELSANTVLFFETNMGMEEGQRSFPITNRRHYKFLKESGYNYQGGPMVYKDCFNQMGGPEDLYLRHKSTGHSGCNIAFADGHTEFITEDRLGTLEWNPDRQK